MVCFVLESGDVWLPSAVDASSEDDCSPRSSVRSSSCNGQPRPHRRLCRICLDDSGLGGSLFRPCDCSGTMKWVHHECLQHWIGNRRAGLSPRSGSFLGKPVDACEVCRAPYRISAQDSKLMSSSGTRIKATTGMFAWLFGVFHDIAFEDLILLPGLLLGLASALLMVGHILDCSEGGAAEASGSAAAAARYSHVRIPAPHSGILASATPTPTPVPSSFLYAVSSSSFSIVTLLIADLLCAVTILCIAVFNAVRRSLYITLPAVPVAH